MKNLNRKSGTVIVAVVASIITIGCSTISTEPHYIGSKERITQGDKQLYAGAQLTESGQLRTIAELPADKDSKQFLSTVILMDGYKQAIVRRELPAGGIKANWGREIDLVFSIQPCNQPAQPHPTSIIKCADQPASLPVLVRKKITLIGGREVTVQFPDGVLWTYQVLDQTSPVALN